MFLGWFLVLCSVQFEDLNAVEVSTQGSECQKVVWIDALLLTLQRGVEIDCTRRRDGEGSG